jgi:peptide/nickel transport system substrate-binding protein
MKRIVRLVAVMVAVAVLTGGRLAAVGADAATTLHLDALGDPHTLNPELATRSTEAYIGGLILEGLVEIDPTLTPRPVLAATVPTQANGGISSDGRTFTFHLRKGVRWHDGAPFTARDVVFTIGLIQDARNNVANRNQYANIAGVDAPDASTVRFHLKRRQSAFISQIAAGYPILPAHLLASSASLATDPFNAAPVGTGPYRFVRWQRGDDVELAANPTYYRGAPNIGRIVVAITPDINTLGIQLRQHAIDFAQVESSLYDQLRNVPGLAHETNPLNDVNAYAMNVTRPIMRDKIVRLAITKAIDRKRIVRDISFGTGTVAYADLPLFIYDGHPPAGWDDSDPAAARAMLDADGWKLGADGIRVKDGVPLRLQMIDLAGSVSGAAFDLQVMQMLHDVGIAITYKTFNVGLYYAPATQGGPVMSGDFDLAYTGLQGGADPDNSYIFSCATRSPAGFNAARYCNPAVDRALAAEQDEYDPAKRNALVATIERTAVADAPYAFLYHTPYRFIMNPRLVRPPANLSTPWYDIQDWTFAPAP